MSDTFDAGTVYAKMKLGRDEFREDLAAVKKELADLEKMVVKPKVALDLLQFRSDVKTVTRELAGIGDRKVSVRIDMPLLTGDVDRANSKLEDLARNTYWVRVRLDQALLEADIQRAQQKVNGVNGSNIKIRLELDTDKAWNDYLALRARILSGGDIEVDLRLNIGGALAQVAALRAALAGMTADVDRNGNMITRTFSKFAGVLGALKMPAGLIGLAPLLLGIANAAAAAAGALGLIPAAIAMIGVGVGAIKLGLSGIGDAFTALSAADDAATTDGAANAAARAQQQKQIAQAVQGVADAQEQAARRIKGAEEGLASAQRSAQYAQEALTRARKDAKEANEDLMLSLKGASLSEEEAALAVERAQIRLNEAAKQGVNSLDYREAELGLRRAKLTVEETAERYGDLKEAADDANKKGVEGSDQVVAAKRNLEDANRGVKSAEEDLAQAQKDGARQVADAMDRLSEAYAANGDAASSAAKKAQDAFDKLSPAAKDFVTQIRGLKDEWTALKLDVQERLFLGLGAAVVKMADVQLPGLRTGLGIAATGFNQAAKEAMGFLSTLQAKEDWEGIFSSSGRSASNFASALQPIVQMFTDIAAVGAPILEELSAGFAGAADRAAAFVQHARETGELEEWIRGGIEAIKQLGELLGNVFGILGDMMKASEQAGGGLLDTLVLITQQVKDFTGSAEGQEMLLSFFKAVHATVVALKPGIDAILKALAQIVTTLAPVLPAIGGALSAILQAVLPLVQPLADIVGLLAADLAQALFAISPLLKVVAEVLGMVLLEAMKALQPIIQAIIDVFIELSPTLQEIAKLFGTYLATVLKALAPLFPPLIKALGEVLKAIAPLIPIWLEFVTDVVEALMPLIPALADIFVMLVKALLPLAPPLIDLAKTLLPVIVDLIQELVPVVKFLAEVLGNVLAWTITNVVVPVVEFLVDVVKFLIDALEGGQDSTDQVTAAMEAAWSALGDAWDAVYNAVIKPVIDAFADAFTWLYENVVKPIIDGWNAYWDNFAKGLDIVYQNVIKPMFDALGDAFTWLYENIIQPVIDTWNKGWELFADANKKIYETVIKPMWDALGDAFKWLYDNVIKPVIDFWAGAWDTLLRGMDGVWKTILKPMFDAIGTALTTVKGWFDTAVEGIRLAWDKLKEIAAAPIRFMVGTVYNKGIVPAWNFIAGLVGLGKLAEVPLAFATGGVVPGYAPGQDTVQAVLSPGEAVIRPEATKELGSDWVYSINKVAARRGRSGVRKFLEYGGEQLQQFASGGIAAGESFARAQVGKPYVWGGVGPGGYDCSGFMSAITNALLGLNPYSRRFATGSFGANKGAGGLVPGKGSAFVIGVTPNAGGGIGHTAGTLNGTNFESKGGAGVVSGGAARGATNSLFPWQFFLPQAGGSFVDGGGGGAPFDAAAWVADNFKNAVMKIMETFAPKNLWEQGAQGLMTKGIDGLVQKAIAAAKAVFTTTVTGSASAPAGSAALTKIVSDRAAKYGWGSPSQQFNALSALIQKESSWNPTAQNPTSTAYGLFQFLNSTWATVGGSKTSDPGLQTEYGLKYIQQRYKDPIGAWAFHKAHNWYDQGGILKPGATLALNGRGENEFVNTSEQLGSLVRRSSRDAATRLAHITERAGNRVEEAQILRSKIDEMIAAARENGGVNIGSVHTVDTARELAKEISFRVKTKRRGGVHRG